MIQWSHTPVQSSGTPAVCRCDPSRDNGAAENGVNEASEANRGARGHRRCIVCGMCTASFFAVVAGFAYHRCHTCLATFLDEDHRLSAEAEYERYCQHRNDPADTHYRGFLSKLADPLLKRLSPDAQGLDYGCGPGPALACMLREAGHPMSLFDLYFFPDPEPLDAQYDFITCTETIEHLHQPAEVFDLFDRMLRPGGWLAVMTTFQTDDDRFASWHYRRDPTHVVFYRETTLHHIALQLGWTCEIPVKNVALMQKPFCSNPIEEANRRAR